jgi:SWI/SNF-related matrix-associated actin-dependent regulator of chromatin subfamily A3
MGLGKTLQMIALILTDPTGAPLITDIQPSKSEFGKGTLIICPLTVLGNWTTQIQVSKRNVRVALTYIV